MVDYEFVIIVKHVRMFPGIPNMDIALYIIVGMITFSSPYLCCGPKASSKNRSCSPADKLPQDRPMAQILYIKI